MLPNLRAGGFDIRRGSVGHKEERLLSDLSSEIKQCTRLNKMIIDLHRSDSPPRESLSRSDTQHRSLTVFLCRSSNEIVEWGLVPISVNLVETTSRVGISHLRCRVRFLHYRRGVWDKDILMILPLDASWILNRRLIPRGVHLSFRMSLPLN